MSEQDIHQAVDGRRRKLRWTVVVLVLAAVGIYVLTLMQVLVVGK